MGEGNSDDQHLSESDLRALTEAARGLAQEIGLETLLQSILKTAGDLTESPETSVLLKKEQEPQLYFAAATGPAAEWLLSARGPHSAHAVPIEGSKAGLVYQSGASLVDHAVQSHYGAVDQETKNQTLSMVCVPLTVGAERLGVIQALNKTSGDYNERDRVLLERFAELAAVAIRNARLLDNAIAHSGLLGAERSTAHLLDRMREVQGEARSETLSILFADMRGFTQFCQSLINPSLVQERLSEFITMLSDAVLLEEGIINKFLGDGLLAIFQGKDGGARAVRCAFHMVREFHLMRDRWDAASNQSLDFLDLGIGITTDQVIIGGIGNRVARDYTVIGPAVNLAAAFESHARDGDHILCDRLTYKNAESFIEPVDPEDFTLKKPGQDVGVRYKRYSLKPRPEAQKPKVFISHSHNDRAFVENLIADLKAQGIETWYSVEDIEKGALWTAEIRKAIAQSAWMLVIVSQNAAHSKWIQLEVDLAIAAEHLDGRILPIVLDDTQPNAVSAYLGPLQGIFVNTTDDLVGCLVGRFKVAT